MLVNKFSHVRFKPAGLTKNPKIRIAKSIVDYMFRWFAAKFLSPDAQFEAGVNIKTEPEEQLTPDDTRPATAGMPPGTVPPAAATRPPTACATPSRTTPARRRCATCGAIMIRNGAYYKCVNCGATSGCA